MKTTVITIALTVLTTFLIITAFNQLSPLFKSAEEQSRSYKAGVISLEQAQRNYGEAYVRQISNAGIAFIASVLSYLFFLAHGWRSYHSLLFRISVAMITAVVFCIVTYAFLETDFYIDLFDDDTKIKLMADILWVKLLSVFAALICGGALFEMLSTSLLETDTKNNA